MDQVWWLLKKLGRTGKRNLQYYIANPREALDELIEYAKENPWKFAFACLGIGLGIACIVVPLAIGFGPAGPILGSIAAGWQSSIGSVAAGSAFALLQSMAMTGAFTAIGGTLIGIGSAIPLVSSLFGRLRSWVGGLFGSGGSGGGGPGPGSPFGCLVSSLDPSWMDKLLLQTAGSDAVLLKRHMQPRRGWFLESKHSKVDFAGSRDREEGAHCERRILITNSQQTWDMVWDHMDAWNDGTIKEYALKGFAVEIRLLRPKKNRRDEEFCEMFIDHEAGCPPDCFCLGDYDNIEEESL